MSDTCSSGSCEGCSSAGNCDKPQSFLEPLNQFSEIKKVIGVVSGKGGVGKSFVTGSLASAMTRAGYKVMPTLQVLPSLKCTGYTVRQ